MNKIQRKILPAIPLQFYLAFGEKDNNFTSELTINLVKETIQYSFEFLNLDNRIIILHK